MDKKISGLIGAAAAFVVASPASATTISASNPMAVQSYSDLLEPIPNALELMKVEDSAVGETQARVQLADYHDHHHHHHHHRYRRVVPRIVIPLLREREYGYGYRHHHHHHHHHHHRYYRRYDND